MDFARILIMDLDPSLCTEDHSEWLERLLYRFLPTQSIDLRTVTRIPSETTFSPPDIILLRPPSSESPAEIVHFLRRKWSPVFILGIFCDGKDRPTSVYQSFLNDLEDFLPCPFREIDVLPRVRRFLQGKRETIPASPGGEMKNNLGLAGLVGDSRSFLRAIQHSLDVADSEATVLISGETGTGKELVARAIHYRSSRQGKPFIPVNCGALPDHLVENELFGHVKGAFTDASSPEKGLVAEAEKGTLFLDEVDTLKASAQVKLLRFLQDRSYRPLGCSKSKIANVRIIAATNVDLWQQVQFKQFREDLYYRLNVFSVRLPPLRERIEDIPLLAGHFLSRYGNDQSRGHLRLSADALKKLLLYPWPGNVRELETVIQRAVILASSPLLQPEDLELPSFPDPGRMSELESFQEAKARAVAQFERAYLINLLAVHKGNITRAAKRAGKERRAFQRLLQKYDLNRGAFLEPNPLDSESAENIPHLMR